MNGSNRINPALITGDVVAFLFFAVAGIRSHEEGASINTLLRVLVPFLGVWLPVAYLLGLFKQRQIEDIDAVVPEVIKGWVPVWAIGLVIRSLAFGRPFAPTFALISFLVNLAFLAGWRAAYAYLRHRSRRHA
jgi:hypothetical protein